MPYDAFNGSLVEHFICGGTGHKINNRAKLRITSSKLIGSILHLSNMSGITIGRVRYGQGQKVSASVLCIPDVSGIPTGRV